MANNDNGWVTSSFTKDELNGKTIYFARPPQNEKFFGNLHVEDNGAGQLRITIDYGGPNGQNGQWTVDQAFADQMRPVDFIVP